jgi:hypothetical protein
MGERGRCGWTHYYFRVCNLQGGKLLVLLCPALEVQPSDSNSLLSELAARLPVSFHVTTVLLAPLPRQCHHPSSVLPASLAALQVATCAIHFQVCCKAASIISGGFVHGFLPARWSSTCQLDWCAASLSRLGKMCAQVLPACQTPVGCREDCFQWLA